MNNENVENPIDHQICKACKTNPSDPSFKLPLCPQCRSLLVNRPYPVWIKVVVVIIFCLVLYSALKFPPVIKSIVTQKAGKTAEINQNYSSAILEYQKILTVFPNSQEHKARLSVCYFKSGEIHRAFDIIETIDEESLSKESISELNTLINQLKPVNNNE